MIQFENVSKTFRSKGKEVHAVKNVSLHVKQGEIFGVIGFSGAGKSTLLRLVNLLERPSEGRVIVHDKEINSLPQSELRRLRRRIGMIFQSFNLFTSRTVYGNVAYPLKLAKYPKDKIDSRVKEVLKFVGLEDKADYYPEQLSGGQKQRVGIARALGTSPDILICDEATSALDPETTGEILKILKRVNEEYNITILLITHEMHVIKSICDRVAVMENGSVIEEGPVFTVFSEPQTQTTKNFISSVLNDQLSVKLLEKLRQNHHGKLYRVVFKGEATNQPLLSQVTRKHKIDFNIVYGSINELQEQILGNLIVEFIGDERVILQVIRELQKQVEIKEVIHS
ncbi:methionine ABC transporter ATP-binding protein [Bacillus horti]|uniref:D-methionine transport system ATP-binding protein n=1 Tax=Caldalkalibacillus horti TaxID=77523 RepID=A0ABT9W5L8_9BACI|nr:methionine ABC transporter ATP-binding protein [Bacillus horti]MDQ0168535.1 D-methionine transport system ATP-binding protein [Bacillus horti]